MEITKEQWEAWLGLPVTKALHQYLLSKESGLKDLWSSGEFTDMSQFGTAILNAKAIGNCEVYNEIVNLDFEQVTEELADE